ncbi:hypothetical protein K503DRAFT_437706 [Rhizopogon vinicolor AM-OR11-026]|uniref:Uncharacterized protein n=1 Tax=Rhizopogon vinicolor AM-OR11-026 TaxID=1314800 RepID=A0A1B7NAH7_9AGAM|nr:hypothetical protein K503DRAFT_437706 [Rhizopogon vinicolor AM-OR11-026]
MTESSRPNMRRKSSAQNLLSSFKPTNGAANAATVSSISSVGSVAHTPTTAVASGREWDGQSVYSDTLSSSATLKRIITLTYMRNVHEGRSHWFHTIMMSRNELDKAFNNLAMRKRTYRFAVLAMSLSNLLDIPQVQDFLRGLMNTMNEYDQAKEEHDKPKIRLFRSKVAKRQGAGFAEYTVSHTDGSEAAYLVSPHIAFPLDYHQTLLSLLDVISEVYNKISRILGPSPFPNSGQHMMGPLGLLAPHPGVSYLFSGSDSNAKQMDDGDSSLWGIAHVHGGYGGALGSPPPSWTPGMGDMLLKVDAKFKKITSALLKELDEVARDGIKDELSSLNPLLRNVASTDDGRDMYDFEGIF